MTGSGKTGMGIILLEEAALKGIPPAILIDPQGRPDQPLAAFPRFSSLRLCPWVDADAAKREGLTLEQAAEGAAASWKRAQSVPASTASAWSNYPTMWTMSFTVQAPIQPFQSASSARSSPRVDWDENKEMLREAISSTVTALLELVGFKNIDPVRSREHILLSNIFETAWSTGKDLDLESLILQVQNPPFENWASSRSQSSIPKKTVSTWRCCSTTSSPPPLFRLLAGGTAARHSKHPLLPPGRKTQTQRFLSGASG